MYALFNGFAFGGILSLGPSVVVSLSPGLGVVGTRFGTCASLASFGVLIGTPVAGAILHGNEMILLVSAGFSLLARFAKIGWHLKGKT